MWYVVVELAEGWLEAFEGHGIERLEDLLKKQAAFEVFYAQWLNDVARRLDEAGQA